MVARLTGTSVQRVEDPRILTGRGRYVDDVTLPGMLHAAFVRSPFPHARVQGIDVSEALRMPGVRAVLTASDLDGVATDLTPVGPPDLLLAPFPALARDTVRLVGDPVAVVLADSRARAEDGAELVEVDYDPLPGVGDMETCSPAPPRRSSPSSAPTWCTGPPTATATPTPPSPPPSG